MILAENIKSGMRRHRIIFGCLMAVTTTACFLLNILEWEGHPAGAGARDGHAALDVRGCFDLSSDGGFGCVLDDHACYTGEPVTQVCWLEA